MYCVGSTNGNLSEVSGGSSDAFVMKLSTSGAIQWVTQLGAATHAPSNPASANQGDDFCNGVAVDSSGNVYCAGSTNGNLAEGLGGVSDSFVMKLDSAGDILWATQLGATTQSASPPPSANQGVDRCAGVVVDGDGGVYCAGQVDGNLGEVSGGSTDSFAMKLNSDGVLQWLTQLGSVTKAASNPASANQGYEESTGIAVDSNGKVYVGGYTNGNVGETNVGSYDLFIYQLE